MEAEVVGAKLFVFRLKSSCDSMFFCEPCMMGESCITFLELCYSTIWPPLVGASLGSCSQSLESRTNFAKLCASGRYIRWSLSRGLFAIATIARVLKSSTTACEACKDGRYDVLAFVISRLSRVFEWPAVLLLATTYVSFSFD